MLRQTVMCSSEKTKAKSLLGQPHYYYGTQDDHADDEKEERSLRMMMIKAVLSLSYSGSSPPSPQPLALQSGFLF